MYFVAPLYIGICENMGLSPLVLIGALMICSLGLIYYLKETSETKLEDYLLEE